MPFWMNKKYIVRLNESERSQLLAIVKQLDGKSQKVRRVQILLQADASGPNWNDKQISEAYRCRVSTVENTRKRFVEIGLEECVHRKKRNLPARSRLLDGQQEATIIAMRLGSPPKGYSNWSLRLLARRVVELGVVPKVSHETLRGMLKKTV